MTPTRSNWEGEDAIYYPQPCQIGTPSWFQVVIHESQETAIAISIYNSDGERVAKMNARGQTGLNKIAFDNGDLAPGIYYYIVQLDGKRSTHKMVLVE